MVQIIDMLLTNHNRPKRSLSKLKGIVVHWTANTSAGADARANRNYFNTTSRSCSAHYIVDDHEIVRCIPDNEVAFHVGATSYTNFADSIREGQNPNNLLIGIEMCVNSDGDWNKTYFNTIDLIIDLFNKYNLTSDNLYRHYDITGKNCPAMMVDSSAWNKFKQDIYNVIHPVVHEEVKGSDSNVYRVIVNGKQEVALTGFENAKAKALANYSGEIVLQNVSTGEKITIRSSSQPIMQPVPEPEYVQPASTPAPAPEPPKPISTINANAKIVKD
jgi:N-acetylmuramoyl-L-alanine amidase CwlA